METQKKSKYCQSRSMPMNKDPQHGGTNKDGSKSSMYCRLCYQEGEFLFKDTAKEMQAFCKEKMIEQGASRVLAWLFT